jgi:hypothetical protein
MGEGERKEANTENAEGAIDVSILFAIFDIFL